MKTDSQEIKLRSQANAFYKNKEFGKALACFLIIDSFIKNGEKYIEDALNFCRAKCLPVSGKDEKFLLIEFPCHASWEELAKKILALLANTPSPDFVRLQANHKTGTNFQLFYSLPGALPLSELAQAWGLVDANFCKEQYGPKAGLEELLGKAGPWRLSPDFSLSIKNNVPKPCHLPVFPRNRSPRKISVLIPVYNNLAYLDECIKSAIYQELEDLEIILVNDGSTDPRVFASLYRYSLIDSRIRLINKVNTGYGHSLNCAIDAARGEYIAILESDDYIEKDMYKILYKEAAGGKYDIVKAHVNYFNEKSGARNSLRVKIMNPFAGSNSDPSFYKSYFSGLLMNPNGIFRTAFLRREKIYFRASPGASFQDIGFYFLSSILASSIKVINHHFYNVRRDNPLSSVYSTDKIYCARDEYAQVENFLRGRPQLLKTFLPFINYRKFRSYCLTLSRIDDKYKEDFKAFFKKSFTEEYERGEISRDLFQDKEKKWLNDEFGLAI